MSNTERLISAKQVATLLGCSESNTWFKTANGTLPKPIKIGNSTRWIQSEIEALIEQKKAARNDCTAPAAIPAPIQRGRNPVPPSTRTDARRPGRPRKVVQEAVPA